MKPSSDVRKKPLPPTTRQTQHSLNCSQLGRLAGNYLAPPGDRRGDGMTEGLIMIDGPAKGREVTSSGPFFNIVFSEMGSCCAEWSHWSMRDVKYDAEGHFTGYGEWEYYQNRIDDFPLRLDPPEQPNHHMPIGEMPRV